MKYITKVVFLLIISCFSVQGQDDSLPKIAVADFTSDVSTALRHGLPNQITERLINSGRFEIYERDKLEAIMQEQQFQQSGFSNPQDAVSLGKLMGVHYILTGNISDFGKEVRNFSGYGVSSQTKIYRLSANIRVLDVETGRVLFSKNGTSEETMTQSNNMSMSDDTVETRLSEKLAADLVRTLLAHRAFQETKKVEEVLAEITITSNPEYADVEIDGVFMGNAGDSFKLPEGLHSIKVSLPGHEEWNKKVMVKDGLTFRATLPRKVDTRIEVEVEETQTINNQ